MKKINIYRKATMFLVQYLLFMFSLPVSGAIFGRSELGCIILIITYSAIFVYFVVQRFKLNCPQCGNNVFHKAFYHSPFPSEKCYKCNFLLDKDYSIESLQEIKLSRKKHELENSSNFSNNENDLHIIIFGLTSLLIAGILVYININKN